MGLWEAHLLDTCVIDRSWPHHIVRTLQCTPRRCRFTSVIEVLEKGQDLNECMWVTEAAKANN